jgi:hypothetical protein
LATSVCEVKHKMPPKKWLSLCAHACHLQLSESAVVR